MPRAGAGDSQVQQGQLRYVSGESSLAHPVLDALGPTCCFQTQMICLLITEPVPLHQPAAMRQTSCCIVVLAKARSNRVCLETELLQGCKLHSCCFLITRAFPECIPKQIFGKASPQVISILLFFVLLLCFYFCL